MQQFRCLHLPPRTGTTSITIHGNVMLLSPMVGEFENQDEDKPMTFITPRSTRLMELAESDSYPTPIHCEMSVGSEDWQACEANVSQFGDWLGSQST